jgi:antitoxin MazE
MRVVIKKCGNSASVRIPAAIMEATSLRPDEAVDVREEGGRIVIEPVRSCHNIEQLVAAITPDNLHAEADFRKAAGKEAF